MNPFRWLLKKLGLIKEVSIPTFKPKEPRRRRRYSHSYFESYHVKLKWKPKTAHEKRLWKPEAKPEED